MRVVPEKSNCRAHHGSAKDGEFSDLRHALQLKISREHGMPADVSEHGERPRSDDRTANSQPVQPVGEIHSIARSDNHQHDEQQKRDKRQRPQMWTCQQFANDEIGSKAFYEGHNQPS